MVCDMWFANEGDPLGFSPSSLTPRLTAPAADDKISGLAVAVQDQFLKNQKARNLIWFLRWKACGITVVYQVMHSAWISGYH